MGILETRRQGRSFMTHPRRCKMRPLFRLLITACLIVGCSSEETEPPVPSVKGQLDKATAAAEAASAAAVRTDRLSAEAESSEDDEDHE